MSMLTLQLFNVQLPGRRTLRPYTSRHDHSALNRSHVGQDESPHRYAVSVTISVSSTFEDKAWSINASNAMITDANENVNLSYGLLCLPTTLEGMMLRFSQLRKREEIWWLFRCKWIF